MPVKVTRKHSGHSGSRRRCKGHHLIKGHSNCFRKEQLQKFQTKIMSCKDNRITTSLIKNN